MPGGGKSLGRPIEFDFGGFPGRSHRFTLVNDGF